MGIISNKKSEIYAYIVLISEVLKLGVGISVICLLLISLNNISHGTVSLGWIACLGALLYGVNALVFEGLQRDSVDELLMLISLFWLFCFIILFGNMYFVRHSSDVSFFKSADNEVTLKCNNTVIKYNPLDVVSYKVTDNGNTIDVSIVMSDTVVNGTFSAYYTDALNYVLSCGVESPIVKGEQSYNRVYPSLANLYIEVCFPVMLLTGVLSMLSYFLVSRKSLHNRAYINLFKSEYNVLVAELVTAMLVATYCFHAIYSQYEYFVISAYFVLAVLLGTYCMYRVLSKFEWFA